MKRIAFTLLCSLVLLAGCKKDKEDDWKFDNKFLTGTTWEGTYSVYNPGEATEVTEVSISFLTPNHGEFLIDGTTHPFTYSVTERILTLTAESGFAGEWWQADILEGKKRLILMKMPGDRAKLDISLPSNPE